MKTIRPMGTASSKRFDDLTPEQQTEYEIKRREQSREVMNALTGRNTKPYKKTIVLNMEMKERIEQKAKSLGLTPSAYIKSLIYKDLEQ